MYTLAQFKNDYPTDDVCLERIFKPQPCSCGRNKWYRIKSRPVYSCACGKQVNPLKGTIFEKSTTPLTTWFYVMYLMSQSKSGISASMIHRLIGGSYKTSWRMCHKIRELMKDDTELFSGAVEADETFFSAKPWRNSRVPKGRSAFFKAPIVFGVVERSTGRVKAQVIPDLKTSTVFIALRDSVELGSDLYTDGGWAYRLAKVHYNHTPRIHWKTFKQAENGFIPASGDSTQQIENFWSQLKRGIYGVYRKVKYLQAYVDEFSFRYSNRYGDIFGELVARL